jgi:hypothetical protein
LSDNPEDTLYPVPARLLDKTQCPEPYITSVEQYQKMLRQSIDLPEEFFGKVYFFFPCLRETYTLTRLGAQGKERRTTKIYLFLTYILLVIFDLRDIIIAGDRAVIVVEAISHGAPWRT